MRNAAGALKRVLALEAGLRVWVAGERHLYGLAVDAMQVHDLM